MKVFITTALVTCTIITYGQHSDRCSAITEEWAGRIKSGTEINSLYNDGGIILTPEADLISLNGAREEYYRWLQRGLPKISNVEANHCIQATSGITYEIGSLHHTDGSISKFIAINKETENGTLRDFEFIQGFRINSLDLEEIAEARDRWVELCNLNNAQNLVSEMYEKDAIYYNHRPVDIGTAAISSRYSYMNSSNYNLMLTPLAIEVVTGGLVFEIGQCSGSYRGKYMLIWRKLPQGNWKILFDSNI